MDSPCLSAAGLRFLDHPIPTEELGVPCGSRTGRAAYSAALLPDLIGVTTFRTDELRPGWVPSLHRGRGVRGGHVYLGHSLTRTTCILVLPRFLAVLVSHPPAIGCDDGSSKVHVRSPVRPSPCLWLPDGRSPLGFCPSASYPAVTGDAWEGGDWRWTLARVEPFFSTTH
jgi:hypothetical protein